MMSNVRGQNQGGCLVSSLFIYFSFLFLILVRTPRSHEYVKYARESSLEFNYPARSVDAGTLLITIVTPAKILTILLRIRFIPHNEPEK